MRLTENYEIERLINEVLDENSFVKHLAFLRGRSVLGDADMEGVVSGFGNVGDISVGVFGTLHEVLLGGIGAQGAKKIVRLVDDAIKIGAPVIGFIDSEGARFAEGIGALEGYSDIAAAFSRAHGQVPVILVVKGKCFGMLSLLTSFCDLCVALPDALIATTSPLLLAAGAGTNEESVANVTVHSQKSGIITNIVENPLELRNLILDALEIFTFTEIEGTDDANRISAALKTGSGIMEIITEVVDDKKFLPLRKGFGGGVVTGFARLNGRAVGIVGGDSSIKEGRITADGAFKITAFITTCENFGLPIINIIDCGGIINCLCEENSALMRNISDMMYVYHNSSCCKIALISGKAVGIGYTAFAGRSNVDYSIAWEEAHIGALSDVQTASLLYADLIEAADNKAVMTDELAVSYGRENSVAGIVAESGYIDNVISPSLSRQYLIAAIEIFSAKR